MSIKGFRRGLSAFAIIVIVNVLSQNPAAWAVPSNAANHNRAAKFFLKYFDFSLGKEVDADWIAKSSPWFREFCAALTLPLDCDQETYDLRSFDRILEVFRLARYQSILGGAIEQGLKASRLDMNSAFAILEETYNVFSDQLEFDKIDANLEEERGWNFGLTGLKIIEELPFETNGHGFKLTFRGEGDKFSLTINSADGRLVFKDGPRLLETDLEGERLSTSMTESFTDPGFRNFGLYQYAIKHYLNRTGVDRIYLYTENPETLEFIYRNLEGFKDQQLRARLIEIPGVAEFLGNFQVSLERFVAGEPIAVASVSNVLGYLSLQGRTRINAGLSFFKDDIEHTIIHSVVLEPDIVAKIKSATKTLEGRLKEHLKTADSTDPVFDLPKAYIGKLLSDLRKQEAETCNRALGGN